MIIKIYSFILIFFIPISFAMDDQQDRLYRDRLQKALSLPADIMQKVGVFPLGACFYIFSRTWLYNQKLDLISANHQNLSVTNGQLDRIQWNKQGKWHEVESGQSHQPLMFEQQPQNEPDWLYDGPNKQYMMVAAATERKEVNSSQEELTRQECNSFIYKFPYQPAPPKDVRLSGMLPNTNIVALAIAYKTNAYTFADCRDENSYLTIVNQDNTQTQVTLEQNFIKRLIFPTGKLLYALSQQGTLYHIAIDSGKIVPQEFKDIAGLPIKIDDFAINMQCPSQAALISSDGKFFMADTVCKKLRYIPIDGLEKNMGLCQLKMFGDRIGIMMRSYDEYKIAMLDIAKIPRAK